MDVQTLAIRVSVLGVTGFTCKWLEEKRNAVRRNYDVFLGFRGLDTRSGFTDHLYNGLVAAKFAVFKDDCELLGEQIEPGLSRAIENSKIAIPIISKRYAESISCIGELTQIMRSYAKHCLLVFPIFYEVDVFDVRHQMGEFGKGFSKLAKHHKPEKVREWRETLRSLTMIRGWTSQDVANGRQGQLVKLVVAKVSSESSESRMPWIERIPMFRKKRSESKCQVFLTFSPATRKGLASTLYHSLMREKISVFSDDDQYVIGKDFAHEIHNAINCCKIFIPIISQDYASSRECLDNLAQMDECNTIKEQKILPIFYKVKPSQVRELSDRFQRDMLQHKVLQGNNTREQWQISLRKVGSIMGWESDLINKGDEGKLVQEVVKKVSALLENLNT